MFTIREKTRRGGLVLTGAVASVILISGLGMNYIRVGGPVHTREALISEFVADIMPPPAYVLEPMLEVSMLMRDPASLPQRSLTLARLEKIYHERASRWDTSELDRDLASSRKDDAGQKAEAFWSELDRSLLPALARGDTRQA